MEFQLIDIFNLYFIIPILTMFYIKWKITKVKRASPSLAGKIVLITGSGNGLGRELCFRFAREKCHIICVDIDTEANQETVEYIQKISTNINVLSFNIDITDINQIKEMRQKIRKELNRSIDILVNNAGILYTHHIINFKESQIEKLINVNLLAHFWTIKTFLPDMLEQNSGTIVAISSLAGKMGSNGMSLYSSSKFAIVGLMESLRFELLTINSKVSTLSVFPGFMATKLSPLKKLQTPGIKYDMNFPFIYVMHPKNVARDIVNAIKEGKSKLILPYYNYIILKILQIIYLNIAPVMCSIKSLLKNSNN